MDSIEATPVSPTHVTQSLRETFFNFSLPSKKPKSVGKDLISHSLSDTFANSEHSLKNPVKVEQLGILNPLPVNVLRFEQPLNIYWAVVRFGQFQSLTS